METLSIEYVLSFKNHPDLQKMDQETLDYINKLNINDKKINNNKKQNNLIIKNPKIQNKKDSLENKVNFILNKLAEDNINNLINDFINIIGKITAQEYETFQKTIYAKIISEINFVKIYLNFFNIINQIYSKVYNYNIIYFINLIESTFINNYTHFNCNDETKRVNNLIIIKTLVNSNILNSKVLEECTEILFNQNKYISDIYFWFNNTNICSNNIDRIMKVLSTNIGTRDRVLLESLLKPTTKVIEPVKAVINNNNTMLLEVNNILEEYLMLDNVDDVIYFINTKCKDSLDKNKFCEYLLTHYFNFNNPELLELLKVLNTIINKNNIQKGIQLYKKNNKYDDNKITQLTQNLQLNI